MVDHLDRSSRTPIGRAISGPWDDTEQLLRLAVLEMRQFFTAYYNAHKRDGAPLVEPEFIESPPLTKYQHASRQAKLVESSDADQPRAEQDLLAVLQQAREGDSSG